MEKYILDFNNGMTEEIEVVDLDAVKEAAENEMAYTQESVYIKDPEGRVLLVSRWNGVEAEDDDEVLCEFGTFGFYSNWEEPWN
ncbi:hypothetical protein [Bacillus pumilus]|uniref:hypothetical protein n=1 Tax=Bacillus pumilus TaxID=1408 RepID=UPI003D72B13E